MPVNPKLEQCRRRGMTAKETAKKLGVSVAWVYTWSSREKVHFTRANKLRDSSEDFADAVKRNRISHLSESQQLDFLTLKKYSYTRKEIFESLGVDDV